MKALKFLLMAVVAVALFSCDPQDPKASFTLTYGYEMDDMGEVIPNTGVEIKNGDVIDVTMDHYEWGEIVAHVLLTNNGSAATFTTKEVRNYDYTKYVPSFCVTLCMMGNGQQEQLWEVGEIDANATQDLAMHLRVNDQESAVCPGVFTISNGTESITFTLNFVYEKEAVPAQ
jgi:hypothetical protein